MLISSEAPYQLLESWWPVNLKQKALAVCLCEGGDLCSKGVEEASDIFNRK